MQRQKEWMDLHEIKDDGRRQMVEYKIWEELDGWLTSSRRGEIRSIRSIRSNRRLNVWTDETEIWRGSR